MKLKANGAYKPGNFQMDTWQVEKVVELPAKEFDALVTVPLMDHPVIAENKSCMFNEDGLIHGLLVLGQDHSDGVLVYSAGYNYAHYAAYLTGARAIVTAQMERAADFIVRQTTSNSSNGQRRVSFEELEKQLGLTIHGGGGFDTMLLEALTHRQEVASAELAGGEIHAACYPDFCPNIRARTPDYFSTLSGEKKAALFHELILILDEFLESENLYEILHDLGMPDDEIRARGYVPDTAMMAAGAVITLPEDADICVWDVLKRELSDDLFLVHAQDGAPVSLEHLKDLTRAEWRRFSDLMDACVLGTRTGEHGTEIVIDGVKPERLEKLRTTLGAHEQAGQAMGPMM